MAQSPTIDAALAQVRVVFRNYPFRPPFALAPSLSPDLNAALVGDMEKILPQYLFQSITGWGDVADFKALLPRLLHALVYDEPPLWNGPRLFEKLRTVASFDLWPVDEQDVIEDFFATVWRVLIEGYPQTSGGYRISDLLRWPLDPTPYLAYWESRLGHLPAVLHLADWIYQDYNLLTTKIHAIGVTPALDAWVLRPEVAAFLEDTARRYSEHPDQGMMATAATLIDWILWHRKGT